MTIQQKNQFLIKRFLNKTYNLTISEHNLFGDATYHFTVNVVRIEQKRGSNRSFKIKVKFPSVIRESDGVDVADCDTWLAMLCTTSYNLIEAFNKACMRDMRRIAKNYLNHELGEVKFSMEETFKEVF